MKEVNQSISELKVMLSMMNNQIDKMIDSKIDEMIDRSIDNMIDTCIENQIKKNSNRNEFIKQDATEHPSRSRNEEN